jgi:hypothetical protein
LAENKGLQFKLTITFYFPGVGIDPGEKYPGTSLKDMEILPRLSDD